MKIVLCAVFAINLLTPLIAMEEALPEKKTLESFYYLHLLPEEILNEIAKYLPSRTVETDEEFLNRVADKTKPLAFNFCTSNLTYLNATFECETYHVHKDDYQGEPRYAGIEWKLSVHKKNKPEEKFMLHKWIEDLHLTQDTIIDYCVTAISWSPDLSKILVYDNLHRGFIINLYTNTKIKSYQLFLSSPVTIEAMALSCDGNYVAKVLRLPDSALQLHLDKIDDNSSQTIGIADLDLPSVTALSFNNQDTQIMVYTHAIDENDDDKHGIIALPESEPTRKSIKTLADYFKQKAVRKKNIKEKDADQS